MVTMTQGAFSETYANKSACLTALDEFRTSHAQNTGAQNAIETADCYSLATGAPATHMTSGDLPAQTIFDKARDIIDAMRRSVTPDNQATVTADYTRAMTELGIPEGEVPMPEGGWAELSDADVDAMLETMAGLVGIDASMSGSSGRHVIVSKSGLEKIAKDSNFPIRK